MAKADSRIIHTDTPRDSKGRAVTYLRRIPRTIPIDRIVAHNHVRPASPLGRNGFRAWLTEPAPQYELCQCGWAPRLPEHYRVGRADAERAP